jgi:signal transduction histidine kinase
MAKASTPVGTGRARQSARPADLQLELDPVPGAAAEARDALGTVADGLPNRALADLRVIVTELVTNGVKYGPGRPIELSLAFRPGGVVRGDIDDGGTGEVRMRTPGRLGGGLGLVIVDALARWGAEPGSSHVWFEYEAALD